MDVLITLTTAGADTGPFNLYSNVDSYTTAFETGVAKSALVAGYLSTLVPASTTYVRVKSTGRCTNYIDIFVTGSATTTTTTTNVPPTTTTTTTEVVTYYNVVLCGTSTPSVIRYNGPNNVTLGVVVQSSNGSCYTVSSVGSGPETVGTLLTQFASCVLCQGAPPPTTTTTTTATPTTTTTTTAGLYRVWNLYRTEGATNPACSTTPAAQVIPYNSNYTVGLVFKGSNGLCYTIANDGYQVSPANITLSEEFGTCTECTETAPTTTTTTAAPTTTTTTTVPLYHVWNLYRSEGAENPACSTTPASQVIAYNSNYAPGVVLKASNGFCYTIANDGYQVTAPLINLDDEFGNCTECTETSPTTTTTTTLPLSYTFNITGGWPTFGEACQEGTALAQIYGYNILFLDNAIFYNSPSLNVPYVGGDLYYKNTGTNEWSRINNLGENSLEGNC